MERGQWEVQLTELDELRGQNASLQERNAQLLRRATDAEEAIAAFARAEVDAIVLPEGATPVLRSTQETLRRNRRLLRAIFDGALDAILLADDDGRYVDANPAACELFKVPLEQLIGRSISEFAAADKDAGAAFRAFLDRGQMRGQFPLVRPDETRLTLEYSAVANVVPGLHLSVLRDVTDRIAAEEALREKEALFRTVVEKTTEAISLTTADGTTRYLTPSAFSLLGFTREEMGTRTLRDQVIPDDRPRLEAELDQLARNPGGEMFLEFRVQHRDGSIRWFESTGTNLLDDPDVRAIVGNYRDITVRKNAEQALHESRYLLEEAQAIAHIGSWTSGIEPNGEIEWSPECYRIFGIPEGTALTVDSFFSCVHPADREDVRVASNAAAEFGTGYDIEHRVQRPDGSVRWVHELARIERDAAGRATRMLGTVQDITERRLAAEELETSKERYRRIVEGTAEGVWVYDAQGTTTFMNGRMAALLGYTVEEAVGQSIYAFMDETSHAAARARTERRRRGIAEGGDLELKRKDGTKVWVSVTATPLLDAAGRFESGLVLVTDVTARRRADEAHALLAAIVESSDDAIVGASLDGIVTSWNMGAERLFQYSANDVTGRSLLLLVPGAALTDEQRILEKVSRGEAVDQYETKRCRKDGSMVDVAVAVSPIRDARGTVIGVSTIARDLTARRSTEATLRRTEEQFRQAQKMEAVGRLAGGVAHDFNNLLSVVLSYAELAMAALKVGDPLRNDLAEIHTAGTRATSLTRQLLAFSRQQILQLRVVDLDQIANGMKSLLRRLLGEDVELTILTAEGIGRVLADLGQIEQVLMNLAVNARDAMPDGGKLTIETLNIDFDAANVGAHLGVAPGKYVMLAVSDTGMGMDPATCARIFEPFFTTKEMGKGTGLGLSTVFGIVEQTGGQIRVYSELGHGTTFKLYLPRTDRPADVADSVQALRTVVGGHETILLVEDEEQVRTVACAILRRNGYQVLEASNGGEAFLIAKDFGAKIDLMLTDVVMPRMSGRKLAAELAPQRPEMKILFASGYTDDAIVHHGVLDGGVAFIQKPFTPDALLRKVREVLDGTPPRLARGAAE